MRDFQKKQKIRRAIYSIPSLIILLIITFFLAKGAIRVMDKGWESMGRSRELKEKAESLTTREEELKTNIARLQTKEGINEEIKEKFNVAQEGELVAVIVDEKSRDDSTDSDKAPWYKRLWTAIIGGK